MVMRRYPGYTLSTLMAEDMHALSQHLALLDENLGKVTDGE
jgi:hypothetical protein